MGKYTIGIDFGTLSARCVLVNVADGKETAVSVCGYRHGVMAVSYTHLTLPTN